MRIGGLASGQYGARQQRLRAQLEARGLAALVVSHPLNIFYLTGFRGSAGVLALRISGGILWVDPRYTLQAHQDARGVEVREDRHGLLQAAARWLKGKRVRSAGYEDAHLTSRALGALRKTAGAGTRLAPAGDLVEELRFVKDENEIARIRDAGRVTVEAFEEVLPEIRPGVKESDLAAELEYRMRRKGAEGAAFETIVASGPRGAYPHARATGKLLQKCELVILDLGAILGGYAADMTRTLYLDKPDKRVRSLYNAVLEAQRQGVEALRPGVAAGRVDAAARRVLRQRSLSRYFTHSTGHGVGLEVHEKPRVARGEKTRLEPGCVVTVEPGIYLQDFGGIRIEDTVHVGADGPEILTPAPKSEWFTE